LTQTEASKKKERALLRLREAVPRLCRGLDVSPPPRTEGWEHAFDSKLLPRISPDFPLMAAICGGGSSGKSTLFNALAAAPLSPVGGSAGINRRVLVGGCKRALQRDDIVSVLFAPFGCPPEPISSTAQLAEPGCPVYAAAEALPSGLLLLDTPDFDTGARGRYTNREVTRQALEAADVLIYIFTNSNYNNRDNTDFISRMLTGIGRRRCFLIYRAYPSFTDEQVRDHAMVVARNLYGKEASEALLGIYRADEDNDVAAGKKPMFLRPVPPGGAGLLDALAAIDPRKERGSLQDAIVSDVLASIRAITDRARHRRAALGLYLDALALAQSRCVADALRQMPMDAVMRRFADIWLANDPTHIRLMRKAGGVVEAPLRLLTALARKTGPKAEKEPAWTGSGFEKAVEEDLISALHRLYAQAVGPEVSAAGPLSDPAVRRMEQAAAAVLSASEGGAGGRPAMETADGGRELKFRVPAPGELDEVRQKLEQRPWQEIAASVLRHKDRIVRFSAELDRELEELADSLRQQMGFWGQVRQTFSALLNILPATAAVTYVLHTGDPAGAAGIKVKLTGLFGLHDLYALVAIPATSGMKKADRRQLESLLIPIARAWLTRKLDVVRGLFEAQITGPIEQAGRDRFREAKTLIEEIGRDLNRCEEQK